jgi:hypothetical protein
VRRIVTNPALLAIAAFLLAAPALAQAPALDQLNASAAAQPVVASAQPISQPLSQPLSQPGARGQLHSDIVPPVPVPPGPVAASQIKPAPPTPIAVKKVELNQDDPWSSDWDVLIEENLPPEFLSSQVDRDVKPFCPRFNLLPEADKRAFWAYFFQALAGAEAGLTPTTDVRHTDPSVAVIDPVTHHITRQEGLLQLTYQDSERYGCDFDWPGDKNRPVHDPDKSILNPGNNLLCGIRILKNQLLDLHEPLLTRKSYWATLRPGTISYNVFARQMANVPEACGQRTVHHQPRTEQPLNEAFSGSHTPANQAPPASTFQSQH